MSDTLFIDVETRSAADLRKTGAYRYFEDPTADVLCAAFAFDDGPVRTWRRGMACPDDVREHILAGGLCSAFNAQFEAYAFMLVLGPKHGWPVPELHQWSDTMAWAAAMSIPQSLDGAARAVGLSEEKGKDGGRLIRKFSMPRRARKGENPGRLYWNEPEDHAADFDAFVAYNAQDVVVERLLKSKLVPLSDYEQRVWVFTAMMNTRGVRFDMSLASALVEITTDAKAKLDKAMAAATGYEVTACSQVSALTAWLKMQGVDADKLNKNAIEDLLAQDLPDHCREAVELRKEAAKTSTAKLATVQQWCSSDGRVRGVHLYHGAGTGRWSGRGPQLQNMPRGTGTVKDPEAAVPDFMRRSDDWIDMVYGSPTSAVSDMLRSTICASDGHRLLAADYSSIEGRVTAWVAGEEDELEAYRAVDNGTGPGIYEIAAGGIFNADPYNVTKAQRQVGKAACVAEGTLVLVRTNAGQIAAKAIQDVDVTDLAWDGHEWVSHSGVVCNGERECVTLSGMKLTPDHLIWCGPSMGWTAAGQVDSSANILSRASAIAKAAWPLRATWRHLAAGYSRSLSSATAAGPSTESPRITSNQAGSCGATPAPKKPPQTPVGNNTFTTRKSAPTPRTAGGCSIAWQLYGHVATSLPIGNGRPTAGAASGAGGSTNTETSGMEGRAALAGCEPANGATRCSNILSRFRGGMIHLWNLIALTTTRDTSRATCGFAIDAPIHETSGRSAFSASECSNLKPKSRVYDLVNCGPRNRFTIFSAEGPLIVHNCLALGFGGGVLAFHSMANIYGIDMAPVFPILQETAPPETVERAVERFAECNERGDTGTDLMSREAWVASEITKVLWRQRHPSTVALWRGLEDAAREAVQKAGTIVSYGRISYLNARGFLWCRLPSGRCLAYGNPQIQDRKTPWGDTKAAVTALGVNSVTKRWERFALYGGLATENVVQAIARDLMANGMLKAEAAGYPIIMTVHDEAVADVPIGRGTLAEFERLLCDLPGWAEGIPLVASGWEGQRYRKD